jgi:hypothetical protein
MAAVYFETLLLKFECEEGTERLMTTMVIRPTFKREISNKRSMNAEL